MRDNVSGVLMRRGGILLASLFAGALMALTPHAAHADGSRLKFLSEKMKDSDARVRTSAALALGASSEDGAVEPLCSGLSDSAE
ncbi:MAG TPA: hypothetical protein VM580_26385, partial [Labilithrix sp.]|nr:hypothetical protein [Labilithrix sp.]